MDRLLREAMASDPVPALSPGFERKLAQRLRPARMNSAARLLMAAYIVAALVTSFWILKNQPLAAVWPLAALVALVPLSYAWVEKLTREYPSLLRRRHPSA
jgi:hypothetical protein